MYYTASRRICIDTFTVVCYNYPISATIMQPFRPEQNQSGRRENATPHIALGIRACDPLRSVRAMAEAARRVRLRKRETDTPKAL